MMFQSIFSGVTAGIGNLVAEGDKKKKYYQFLRSYLALVFLCFYFMLLYT